MQKGLLDPDLQAVLNTTQPIVSIMQKWPSNPDLQSVQNIEQSIVSIIQKRPPEPWLTCCSKPRATIVSIMQKCCTLTYILFRTQTIALSESCRKGLLDSDLHPDQNVEQPIVSIMQTKRPPGSWLTSCSKHRAAHCQYHAEEAFWTLTYNLFKTQTIHCQHHAEKASCTLTYTLFKTQTIPLSASCRKNLMNPDLQAVQHPK